MSTGDIIDTLVGKIILGDYLDSRNGCKRYLVENNEFTDSIWICSECYREVDDPDQGCPECNPPELYYDEYDGSHGYPCKGGY